MKIFSKLILALTCFSFLLSTGLLTYIIYFKEWDDLRAAAIMWLLSLALLGWGVLEYKEQETEEEQ